ncbi:MAG: HAD hydrolase-like protein [Nitrospirales bacterium]|nr:HAD family hydrolase [Nitrospira sp.]MDR4461403.1 HAD hydrolase-like protein [Nitrospirales bacterium]MDR4482067.1 HAD hydrolase-like protein [Nitrospirales bacterium]
MMACVTFDFDGTLVDSNQVKVQSFYKIVENYDPSGCTVTEVLQRCSHKDRYGITRELAREFMAKGLIPPHTGPEVLGLQWAETYTTTCETAIVGCPEIPGASGILSWLLNQEIPLYLNSRTPTKALNRLVTRRNLTHYFSGIYGAPASKLENLLHIQELTQAKPEEMLFVGDSEDDWRAAAEFGCHFAGVILGGNSRFTQMPPRHMTNLAELRAIVENLQEKRNDLTPNH